MLRRPMLRRQGGEGGAAVWSWALMGLVLVVALAVGAQRDPGPPTDAQRAHRIATQIRCPTCRGLSAADSDAPAAQFIRDESLRRVRAGETDAQIVAFFVNRYGSDILLKPEGRGVAGLVWALPAAGVVLAVGGLALTFRRRRARPRGGVSAADRALVEEALRR
jgi:cytochrome c-type biogenesis protein CcmH